MTRIETKDANGKYNGWVQPLWHCDTGPRVDQVYMTTVAPGCHKGPHLHRRRCGLFYLISGTAMLVVKVPDVNKFERYISVQDAATVPIIKLVETDESGYIAIQQPFGVQVFSDVPCALYNTGSVDAVFLNMPSPPWRESEPDEHPVEDWSFKL